MAEYFAYPLMMFIATPFFLLQLGKEQYGQWMLMLAFTGFGGIAGLGMGMAAIKEVSAYRGRGDMAGAILAVRACFGIAVASSLALAVVILALVWLFDTSWLARAGTPDEVKRIIYFAVALVTVEQIDTVFAGAIRGMERFDVAAKIEMAAKLVIVTASALAAWLTFDLGWVIAVVLAITLVRAVAKAVSTAFLMQARVLSPIWERKYVAEAIRFGKWTWLQSMGSALFSTADRLLVGAFLGSGALAQYSVCLQLAQQVQAIPAAGGGFIFPLVSRRIETGADVHRIALAATVAFGLFAIVLALPLLFFGHTILFLWIGTTFADQNAALLGWLAGAFVLLALNIGSHFFLLGSNAAHFVAFSNITAGVVSLFAGYFLVSRFGLEGAALMRFVYGAVLCSGIFAMMHELRRSLELRRSKILT